MSNIGADAVIVGSAIIQMVNRYKDNNIDNLQNRLKNYVTSLKVACSET
jgi:tryptophan synthase alpha subunit